MAISKTGHRSFALRIARGVSAVLCAGWDDTPSGLFLFFSWRGQGDPLPAGAPSSDGPGGELRLLELFTIGEFMEARFC